MRDEERLTDNVMPDRVMQRSAWGRFWARPLARLDAAIMLSLVILAGLAGVLAWDYSAASASPSPARSWREADPALEMKREAGRLWAAGQRQEALAKWEEAYALRPTPDLAESLAQAHLGLSADRLRENDVETAWTHLQAAYTLLPEEPAVTHEYQALLAYRAGRDAVAARDWATATEALTPLYGLDPGYLDVSALIEQTLAGQQEDEAARRALAERAFSRARGVAAGELLRVAMAPVEVSNQPGQMTMPDIGPAGMRNNKHIVVSINAQRMWVYENGRIIWDWTASTGEPGRPTIPGRYRIQSKIENARSNVWSLWMPSWQGLYWAGSVENGIHGQVTFDSGGRLWEGYLGTRITYGCVMLSDENAAMLFNWTEVGTPVSIHWDWDPAWVPDANGDPIGQGTG